MAVKIIKKKQKEPPKVITVYKNQGNTPTNSVLRNTKK